MRCGWCDSRNAAGTNCASCGGPLSAPSAGDPGPRPPPAPREVPAPFVRRALWRTDGAYFGAIFGGVGLVISLPFCGVGLVFPPMLVALLATGGLPAFGLFLFWRSWRRGQGRLEVLRRGRAVVGEIDAVRAASSDERGDHPGLVSYLFEVAGRRYAGATAVSGDVGAFRVGSPIHVVYLAEDPERNEVWPLLG